MDPFVRGLMHVDFRANKDRIVEMRHETRCHQLLTRCIRNQVSVVQLWGLPSLDLQHELCLYQDITAWARIVSTYCLTVNAFLNLTDG